MSSRTGGTKDGQRKGTFTVKGRVVDASGHPLVKGVVRAVDRDLRSEQLLGEDQTDLSGHYQIRYSAAQFTRAEKGSADLVVRAYGPEGALLATSPIHFNAGPDETIDLVVGGEKYRGPSEYARLISDLTPLLQSITIGELTEDQEHQDVSFLSGETGNDPGRISFLILAHRLQRETDLSPEVFYGLFRQGLPTQLPALLAQSPDVQHRALLRAAEANIISHSLAEQIERILEQLKGLVVHLAMKPPAEGDGRATLNDLLSLTLKDPSLREAFLTTYANQTGPIAAFWRELEGRPDLVNLLPDLQRTLQWGALTGNHLPLVQKLEGMWQERAITTLADLARFDEQGWLELITKEVGAPAGAPGETAEEKSRNYAKAMSHMVEDAFPTAFVAYRLETDDLPGRAEMQAFLTANPEFNLRSTRLGAYLKANPKALESLKEGASTQAQIQALQRVYKLAPRYHQTSALIKGGLDSAQAIARMGENQFLNLFGDAMGGYPKAKIIKNKAQQVTDTALNIAMEYGITSSKTPMNAAPDEAVLEVDGVPEWSTLFGSIELCSCEECRSVYSPAAYLVDALHFLSARPAKVAGLSAKEILFQRRPDLGEIELTCENTNTPLPYVDLVNEALENAVAPYPSFLPLTLPDAVEADLNSRTLSLALRSAFTPPLSTEAVITVGGQGQPGGDAPDHWTIDEPSFTYSIRKEQSGLQVVARSLQTKGAPAERAANPQYVNTGAYDSLSQAVYPLQLPFDLWTEEARTYLDHLGVPHFQLVESLQPGDRSTILEGATLARHHLGLTPAQADLITGATTSQPGAAFPGPWNLWGFAESTLTAQSSIPDPADSTLRIAGGDWLAVLSGRVDVFLQQSGLTYREMLALLSSYYVNPITGSGRQLTLLSTDSADPDTCETAKMCLAGFDQETAARAIRFVRLWRAIGWSMTDLDRAITAFAPDEINDWFLTRLSHVERLQKALGAPVLRLLSWWSPIDTAFYLDHTDDDQPRLASLYDQLFRNRAVVNPTDPAFTEDPAALTGTLSGHAPAITAALGISSADFGLLLSDAEVIPRESGNPAQPDDRLTLEYLSRLHRHATLAKALHLAVPDYLTTLRLTGTDPFATTTGSLIGVERAFKLHDAGFTPAELESLLNHQAGPEADDSATGPLLTELRAGLAKIVEEHTFRTAPDDPVGPTIDLNGDLTRQRLGLLNWEPALIDQVIATLNGAISYATPLGALPAGIKLPKASAGEVRYNVALHQLEFTGPMTKQRKTELEGASSDLGYLAAVQALYDAPRSFISRAMRAFAVHDFAVDLAALPAGLKFPNALKRQVYFDAAAAPKRLHGLGVMSEPVRDALLGLSADLAYKSAVTALFGQADALVPAAADTFLTTTDLGALFDTAVAPGDRFLAVLKKLMPYLRQALSEQFAVQKLAEALQLDVRVTDGLLRTWLASPVDPQANPTLKRRCLAELLEPAFAESNPNLVVTASAFPAQFRTVLRAQKAASVITRFTLTYRQVGWLFTYGPTAGWLDLNGLPTESADPAAPLAGYLALADLAALRSGLSQGEKALDDLLAKAAAVSPGAPATAKNQAKQAWFKSAMRWTKWAGADLESLLGAANDHTQTGLLGAAFPADYAGEPLLLRLRAAFSLLKRLGISAVQAVDLTTGPITQAKARGVRQAVRAKYEEEQWLTLAKPLRDALREQQRAALVAYLVAHLILPSPLRDSNDLYAHFLLDVEMDPIMMTSRIKQAISSVQLFVQRSLMNLEPDVAASADVDVKWREWKWMKNYRVWEANRKIFLYAENWIEPELRDDKSPFFTALEGELLQSDLTQETAAEAYQHYLEKLDQVASLAVVAIHHQLETDSAGQTAVDILHVVARTRAYPHIYFYRQRVDATYWTAWEQIDLDIEGEQLIVTVYNRRLFLFWPVFTEKPVSVATSKSLLELSGETPNQYYEIKLAWSERKQAAWTPKRLSSEQINWGGAGALATRAGFFLRTVMDDQNDLYFLVLHASKQSEDDLYETPAFRFDGYQVGAGGNLPAGYLVQNLTGTTLDRMYLQENGDQKLYLPAPTDSPALAQTPGTFRLLPYANGSSFTEHPFFYSEEKRSFFITPSAVRVKDWHQEPDPVAQIPDLVWEEVTVLPDPVGPIINPADPSLFDPTFAVAPIAGQMQKSTQLPGGQIGKSMKAMRFKTDAAPQMKLMSGGAGQPVQDLPMNTGIAQQASWNLGWYSYQTENRFRFHPFYHPYGMAFVHELARHGLDGLLQRRLQTNPTDFAPRNPSAQPLPPLDFKAEYQPHKVSHRIVLDPYPIEDVDFEEDGAYALYNWELFFHGPLLVADRLSKNQRYEEAQKWFHYIFDPTDTSGTAVPQRYWRTRPFFERTREGYQHERIQYILALLAAGADPEKLAALSAEEQVDLERFQKSVDRWRKDPFKPHLIARTRTTAYQKAVVMKYLDNLIAWADQLFRRDTIESINEASLLYVLAAEILGRRPESIPPRATAQVQTFNSLEPNLDAFSNALVQIEEFISPSASDTVVESAGQQSALSMPAIFYFCVPKNDKLLTYWDSVADRLFKIRHSMNIEGIVRQLPLFEPPIDPALLVKAAAAGLDLGSVLNDLSVGMPHYRFQVLAQKVSELCGDLKSLGGAMLAALEKRDAEKLSLLRSEQETALLALVEQVKKLQADEAEQAKKGLLKSRDTAATRFRHYQKLLGVQSPEVPGIGEPIPEGTPSKHVSIETVGGIKTIAFEQAEMAKLQEADDSQDKASWAEFASSIAHIVPNWNIQPWGMGPTFGGSNVGLAISAGAGRYRADATEATFEAGKNAKLGQYALRAHEWLLQSNLAGREIMQIDQQIVAAELRGQIAERELVNHRRQLNNAKEVESFLRDKYTNQELYGWMVGQVATVYFQAYQLTYDLAKRAERAFRHELGLKESSFIQFGYWDSLKKGLLAGDRLSHDLKRMEAAYLEQNKREYEISKHASLAQLDPLALVQLRQTGTCTVRLPEALYDLDFAGHYMRRVKTVGVSIPCVTGPYTGVHCTLTLLKSTVRQSNTLLGGKYGRQEGDPRFSDSLGTIQSIVTSGGQDDHGLFEPNLRDERFLPFEGAGAISEWQLSLPNTFRQFDYDTISDVILHVRYTAREGGGLLGQQSVQELQAAVNSFVKTEGQQGLAQIISLRHEFPTEWYRFLNGPADQTLTMALTKERFPFLVRDRAIAPQKLELFVKVKPQAAGSYNESSLKLSLAAGSAKSSTPMTLAAWNGLLRGSATGGALGDWTLTAWLGADGEAHQPLSAQAVQDIMVVCHYTCS